MENISSRDTPTNTFDYIIDNGNQLPGDDVLFFGEINPELKELDLRELETTGICLATFKSGNIVEYDSKTGVAPPELVCRPSNECCVLHRPPTTTMYDILVECKIFKSKSDARKNWNRTGAAIPRGFSLFTGVGKLRKSIAILNPIPPDEVLTENEWELRRKFDY